MTERSRRIDIHHGATTESWLVIYADGRIEYHVENDGYRYLRRGPEARDEWVDLYFVRQNWPHLVHEVELVLTELRPEEEQ